MPRGLGDRCCPSPGQSWLSLSLIVVFTLAAFQALAFSSVRVQVLDRGQADGIVIRTPNSQWVVIDAGTNGQQGDYMAEMGIETVALAIISHRHFDHHGGMDEVLRDLTVERLAAVMEDCPKSWFAQVFGMGDYHCQWR